MACLQNGCLIGFRGGYHTSTCRAQLYDPPYGTVSEGAITCLCGNDPCGDGLFTCTAEGVHIEPTDTPGNQWQGHYICDSCGLIWRPNGLDTGRLFPTGSSRGPGQRSIQSLVVEFMAEDLVIAVAGGDSGRCGDIAEQLDEYFRGDAVVDRLAAKVTGWHMTSVETVLWPATEWADCWKWLTGELTLDNWQETPR